MKNQQPKLANSSTMKVLLLSLAIALPAAILLGLVAFRFAKKPARASVLPATRSTTITLATPNTPSPEAQKLLASVSQALEKEVVLSESTTADIIISNEKSASNQPFGNITTGKPQPLSGPTIILKSTMPLGYAEFSRNIAVEQKDAILASLASSDKTAAEPWSMNIIGDIIIGRTVYEQQLKRRDFTSSFANVAELTKNADYTIANAEWTAADGIPYPLQGLSFASPEKSLEGLKYAGIDAVSLANNHSMNGGTPAFESMLASLNSRGIGYFGAGKNFAQAHAPYIATIKNTKLALLGYTAVPGNVEAGPSRTGNAFVKIPPWYPTEEASIVQVEKDIAASKAQASVVIPYFHWSKEYTHTASAEMRQLAHRAIDAGATIVIGSHPHWVQGIELYKGKLIVYSLGNFVFDQEQMLKTKQGAMLSLEFAGSEVVNAKFTPIQIEQYYQPRILESPALNSVLQDIYRNSWWNI